MKKHAFPFTLTLCGSLFLPAAVAQSGNEIEVIEVTAQAKVQPLYQIPISMSVLSEQQLEQYRLDDLEKLTEFQPGVFIAKNTLASKMYIRGIGSQGNAGLEQALSVYVDDIYYGRSRHSKGLLVDVERIELLKGPQSVYFGLNASAGALAVHSRKPSLDGNNGYALMSIGSDDTRSLRAAYNQVIDDNWAVRVAAEKSDSDGPWTVVDSSGAAVGNGGGHDSALVRLSTLYDNQGGFSAWFKLQTQTVKRQNPFAWQPGGCDNLYALGLSSQEQLNHYWQQTGSTKNNPLKVPVTCKDSFVDNRFDGNSPASPFNDSNYDSDGVDLSLQWQFGPVTLRSVSAYYDNDYVFDGNDLSHGTTPHRIMWSQDQSRQLSQHLKLYSDSQTPFDYLVGVYWHQNHVDFQSADVDGRSNQNLQYIHALVQQQTTTSAIYGALDWHVSDKLDASFGLRFERSAKTFDAREWLRNKQQYSGAQAQNFSSVLLSDVEGVPDAYQDFVATQGASFNNERENFSYLMPSVDLKYHYSPYAMAYYKWTRGQKSGGFNFRLNDLDEQTLRYEPESVNAHELGVKHYFTAQQLRLSAALFSSDYGDLQQNSNRDGLGNSGASVIRNAAKAHSRGVELEFDWQLSDSVKLNGLASWLNARFDDYQGADCTRLQAVVVNTDVADLFGAEPAGTRGCVQDLSGKPLSMAPDFATRLSAEYVMTLANHYRLSTSLIWVYSDGYFTSPHADALRYQGDFNKYHLRVALQPMQSQWYFALLGYNLSNELTSRQFGQDGNAAVSALLDLPRSIQLQAKYRF